jgi:hypothetical protein
MPAPTTAPTTAPMIPNAGAIHSLADISVSLFLSYVPLIFVITLKLKIQTLKTLQCRNILMSALKDSDKVEQ